MAFLIDIFQRENRSPEKTAIPHNILQTSLLSSRNLAIGLESWLSRRCTMYCYELMTVINGCASLDLKGLEAYILRSDKLKETTSTQDTPSNSTNPKRLLPIALFKFVFPASVVIVLTFPIGIYLSLFLDSATVVMNLLLPCICMNQMSRPPRTLFP